MIKVTRLHKPAQDGSLKAFVDIEIDGKMTICSCRLIFGNRGAFVAMPSQKREQDSKYYDVVLIKDTALKAAIEKAAMEAYEAQTPGHTPRPTAPATAKADEGSFFGS